MNERKQTKRKIVTGRDQWKYRKLCNIRIIRDPKEEKLKSGTEKVFKEIIVNINTNMAEDINLHNQEAQ